MEDSNVKLIAIRNDIKLVYSEVSDVSVSDDLSFNEASTLRNKIQKRKKRVDELRKEAIAPFKEEVDRYNNLFKIEIDQLDNLLKSVDKKLIAYTEEQERKAKELQKKLIEERENNKEIEQVSTFEVVEAPKTTVRTETGTMSVKKIWTYEILDLTLLMKSHPEFFIPDSKQINDFVKTVKEEKEMDGLRIYQKTSLASRS